jgi:hypothetical protein
VCTNLYFAKPGDRVRADFGDFGQVDVTFTTG